MATATFKFIIYPDYDIIAHRMLSSAIHHIYLTEILSMIYAAILAVEEEKCCLLSD